jgi:voltage-gated potassium channel
MTPQKDDECLAEGYLALLGDASDDASLEKIGIRRARGLVAAVNSDADNVFVTLSAREMNPNLRIVARTSSDEAAKLEIAGADRTLSPYAVGGRRLAYFGDPAFDHGLPRRRDPWQEGNLIQARGVLHA